MSSYTPTPWVDDAPPPLNDNNLNHAEVGIEQAHERVEAVLVGQESVAKALDCNRATYAKPASEAIVGAVKAWVVTNSSDGEKFGFLTAPAITDLPQPVIDFNATDNLPGVIRIKFTKSAKAIWFDLYRDDIMIATNIGEVYDYYTEPGTWDFYVVAVNLWGEVKGVSDSGTAKIVPTEPPADIIDFDASEHRILGVEFNWTDHGDAIRFDLYQDGMKVETNIEPGHQMITGEGTWDFNIKAINLLGITTSNIDSGTALKLAPGTIVDFNASDDKIQSIETTFTPVPQPVLYDLYKDGSLIREQIDPVYLLNTFAGTWDFLVKARNNVGSADSNTDSGTAITAVEAPSAITDFEASDTERYGVVMNFTVADRAAKHSLYQDDTLIADDILPGHKFLTTVGTWDFFIRAINPIGEVDSNVDEGTALPAFAGPPTAITDLIVSEDLVNKLKVSFSLVADANNYDLYRDGVPYKLGVAPDSFIPTFAGEWNFQIWASNPKGETPSNTDKGQAMPATDAPGAITDFSATTDEKLSIIYTFSDAVDAARYDLYRDGEKFEEGIYSGYVQPTPPGTWEFHIVAVNLKGQTPSNKDEGTAQVAFYPPSAITDFSATDGLFEQVVINYTLALNAMSYDLYKDDSKVATGVFPGYIYETEVGTAEYYVVAINNKGQTPSNTDEGTALATPQKPGVITDFAASTNLPGRVRMTFSAASNANSYELFKNGVSIATNVSSGYEYTVAPGSATYHVDAINPQGSTSSNADVGSSIADGGSVTIAFEYVSGSNPETVTGANGSFVFTVPAGITTVSVCMCGGGGSGGGGLYVDQGNQFTGGGGAASGAVSGDVSVTSGQTIQVTLGKGGYQVGALGGDGEASTFGTLLTAAGADGGSGEYNTVNVPGVNGGGYGGRGYWTLNPQGPVVGGDSTSSGCGSTYTGGSAGSTGPWFNVGGGGGGASHFAPGGNGGSGTGGHSGKDGSGGGGAAAASAPGNVGGAGGNGMAVIKWG